MDNTEMTMTVIEELKSKLQDAEDLVQGYEETIKSYEVEVKDANKQVQDSERSTKAAEKKFLEVQEKLKKAQKFQEEEYQLLISELFEEPKSNLEESIKYQSTITNYITLVVSIVSVVAGIFISSYVVGIKFTDELRGGELSILLSRTISLNDSEREGSVKDIMNNLLHADHRQILLFYLSQLDNLISSNNQNGVFHAVTIISNLKKETLMPYKGELVAIYKKIQDSSRWRKTSKRYETILEKVSYT